MQDHPNKINLLKWMAGVKIEDFLQSLTEGNFQGIPMHFFHPQPQQFENDVPPEFEQFMNDTVKEWET